MQEATTQDTATRNHHLSPQAAHRGGSQTGQDDRPKDNRGIPTRDDGGSQTGTDDGPKPDRGAATRSDGGTDDGGSSEGGSQTGGDTGTKSDRGA